MGTTIESDWENTRLLDELEAARAEIERLQAESDPEALHIAYLHGQADRNQKLAAEQAKNVDLLDFIARAQVSSGVCCCGEPMDGHSSPMSCGHSPVDMWDHAVGKLLDAQSDDSALEAVVKKAGEAMRERSINVAWNYEPDCNGPIEMGIRALPAVTLEDLK